MRGYVNRAYAEKAFDEVTALGIDETSSRKGHNYVTVFSDMKNSEILFATEGKGSETVKAFTEELHAHGANAETVKEVTIDMSPA